MAPLGLRIRQSVHGEGAIDVHIMRLRKKIEPDPANPTLIKTIHGIGYTLADDITWISKSGKG